MAIWKNELEMNNTINNKINEACLKNGINLIIKRKDLHWPKGRPDGIGFVDDVAKIVVEYKLIRTYKNSTLERAICQDLCYTYDKYGNSIIPIRLHLAITENELMAIRFDKYDILYENFSILREQYSGVTPNKLYDSSPEIRKLLADIRDLADFIILTDEIDYDELVHTIDSML